MIKNKEFFDGSLPVGFDGLFDWDVLTKYALPKFGGVDFMDIDAILERHTRFLVFETKTKGSRIPTGQQLTLNAMHSLGCFTILVVKFGADEKDMKVISGVWVMYPNDKDYTRLDTVHDTYEDKLNILINVVRGWWKDANNKGVLTIRKDKPTKWLKLKAAITSQWTKLQRYFVLKTTKAKQ